MRLCGRRYPGWVLVLIEESNRRHPAYKAGTLPAELNQPIKKPKALTSGLKFNLLPVHTTLAQYQIYTKCSSFSSVLQYLDGNLSTFVVNVIWTP